MIRLAVSVEGQTEREFVKRLLVERLRLVGIAAVPVLFGGRGGGVTVDRLCSEMTDLAWSHDAVTSLIDYYGLRGRQQRSVEEVEEFVRCAVTRRMRGRHTRVLPYVQRYEFEGLLFSDLNAVSRVIDVSPKQLEELKNIRSNFATPESINDGRDSAPSKRLKRAIPAYDKVLQGPEIAERTTIEMISRECPRFRDWISRLETLQI